MQYLSFVFFLSEVASMFTVSSNSFVDVVVDEDDNDEDSFLPSFLPSFADILILLDGRLLDGVELIHTDACEEKKSRYGSLAASFDGFPLRNNLDATAAIVAVAVAAAAHGG
jgi:hypothetical protein